MNPSKGLRNGAIASFIVAMLMLLIGGYFAKDKVPPVPDEVVHRGEVLTNRDAIKSGQDVYQRYGLMDHGSVWGHGSLRGPDFSADTLHMMGEVMRDYYASGGNYTEDAFGEAPESRQNAIEARVKKEIHENTYDPDTGTIRLNEAQAFALEKIRDHWENELGAGSPRYGFLKDTVTTSAERKDIADFFFWTAWAAGTDRPGKNFSYTNNWPPDRSVGNSPTTGTVFWTLISILALLLVLGLVIYIVHRYRFFYGEAKGAAVSDALLHMTLTPSQLASAKFFLVAGLLFVVQIFVGGLLAHYTVHPGTFYLSFVADLIPYSWAKTWHLQLAIFWIAISWIGTAIYLAPLIAQREMKAQRFLVNVLFVAAFLVVVGSLAGEALSIKGMLGEAWYWLGHQGWEYIELGRLWQILLFGGLIFWLVIVYRGIAPVLKDTNVEQERKSLIIFYVLSAIFVVAFYGFGLFYGRGSHMSIADYWRWFVVHLWVESIFEFFGVAVISLFLVSLGLVSAKSAIRVAYLTAILVFISGIPGTAHHYFWFGGPTFWLAMGGVFASLEPVPLILLVVRAWMEYKHISDQGREFPYKWPLYFLVASSFWNFLGAGVFGFLINLPIVNYYEHATYLTANHGHTALFGVYGMLAIALILFSWRGLVKNEHWNDRLLKLVFWGLNGGLFLLFATTLLPVGLAQFWHSYETGFWFARSAEFYEKPFVQVIGTWRMAPDLIIIVLGALPLLYFLATTFLKLRKSGGEPQIPEKEG